MSNPLKFLGFCGATLRQLWSDLTAQKTRAFFAVAGITWGVYAFVVLLAIGNGIYSKNQRNIDRVSRPTVLIYIDRNNEDDAGESPSMSPWFSLEDQEKLKTVFPEIKAISPVLRNHFSVLTYKGHTIMANVAGKMSNDAVVEDEQVLPGGRFISPLDNALHHRVMVITSYQQQALFPGEKALGKIVRLNDIPFRIVGILDTRNLAVNINGFDVMIPYNTEQEIWQDSRPFCWLLLHDNVDPQAFIPKVLDYLGRIYHLDQDSQHAFTAFTPTKFRHNFMALLMGMQIFLIFCGLMMLIVGGIGISNMMYLSVKERTAEIGLKLAIGAKSYYILTQFLLETALFCFFGGLVAIVFATLTVKGLQHVLPFMHLGYPSISGWTILVAWFVLSVVAFAAGISPAREAANTLPVEALRSL